MLDYGVLVCFWKEEGFWGREGMCYGVGWGLWVYWLFCFWYYVVVWEEFFDWCCCGIFFVFVGIELWYFDCEVGFCGDLF